MGFIQRLFGQQNKPSMPMVNATKPKDERKAECPACHGILRKIPGSKTKCPHCGQFMYIRTHPSDQARVVVTETEANRIDEEWSIINGTHDEFLAQKQAFEDQRDELRKRFGKEPLYNDVKWALLNKEKLHHARDGNWGFYRNSILQMAELVQREGRLKNALAHYLEICCLDLNGPENIGGAPKELIGELELLPFNPKHGMLAPGIIDRIKKLQSKLDFQKADLKELLMDYCKESCGGLNFPIPLNTCWQKLEEALK